MKSLLFASLAAAALLLTGCRKETADFRLNGQLLYGGEPLVMLKDYRLPDGKLVRFTRISMYISDLEVSATGDRKKLISAELINFTPDHSNVFVADVGTTIFDVRVDLNFVDDVRFNIGLTSEQNGTTPADHPSGHPLSRTGEYWTAWSSYVFVKIEGQIDLDGDDEAETGLALHLGGDEMLRGVRVGDPNGLPLQLTMQIDVRGIFENTQLPEGEGIFDVEYNPQIHSLSQMPAILELTENMLRSISFIAR